MSDTNQKIIKRVVAHEARQQQSSHVQDANQIMYQALLAILAAPAFFNETKELQQIAAEALSQIARR